MNLVQDQTKQQGCYKLWSDCFGDSKQYMDYYFSEKTKDNEIYHLEKEGEVISMLHLNPFHFLINGTKAKLHYIVGVATKEEERGQGLMRQVLTDTLRLQQERGELFTYLMPAAKEIYLPYDFRYIYTQQRVMGTLELVSKGISSAIRYESLDENEQQDVVSYVNSKLEMEFDCAVVRNPAYYKRLCKEMQAAGGDVIVIREGDSLLGVTAFMLENGHLEVVETIAEQKHTAFVLEELTNFLANHYKEQNVEAAWLETHFLEQPLLMDLLRKGAKKEQPIIMARLLCVKEALELLQVRDGVQDIDVKIQVEDPIIKENNQQFHITGDATRIVVGQQEAVLQAAGLEKEENVVMVSIADLTEWYFGERTIPVLEGIQTLVRPYINDIV